MRNTELAVAAGLFCACPRRPCREWFRDRKLGGLSEVHVIALVQFGDHDLNAVGRARQEKFSFADRAKRRAVPFLQNLVNGDADFVLIGAGFRLDGEGVIEGSGNRAGP
jgi:hypothetical protein